jgi:HYR domain
MPRFGVYSPRLGARTAASLISSLILAGTLGVALNLGTSHPSAQAPTPEFQTGKNVDIVGPHGTVPYHPAGSNPFLLGDPDKKQQNEPSCDISPNNPLIVFCGMNSYSAVDRPDIIGEPWVGASFTMNGGLTWKSHLHPGFKPKDPAAPAPFAPPLGYETAADPVVRLAPGIGLFSFIAFNRDGAGALLLGRWYERTIESGFPYAWKDTVQIAKGTGSPTDPGRFLDKPAMTVSLLPGSNIYNFNVPDPTPAAPNQTRIQKVPAGIVHVAYAVFTGNTEQDGTKIIYTRSTSYGDNWDPATTLSESQSINQAPDIATDQATRRVVLVWRRFANPTSNQTDAIMSAISLDDGRSFGKPIVVANTCSFTQNTTSASFRTTTHPFITFDGTAFHAIWAERQGPCGATPTGYSRIVMSNLSFGGSTATWSNPSPVDTVSPGSRRGHEFLPAIVSAGNRILVSWLDTRNDVRVGDSYPDPIPDPYVNDYVFAGKTKVRRRSADIFAAEAFAGQTPTFGAPKQVSRYLFGVFPGEPAPRPLERNKVNPRMFQAGKVPFLGDYTTAAAVRFVLKDPINSPNVWVSSAGAPNVQPIFQLAWTDNRLVRGDVSAGLADATGTPYTPPPPSIQSEPDPTTPRGVCSPTTAGTRDQSVFSARITPPVVLLTASASKPTIFSDATGTHRIRRSYALVVRNTSQSSDDDKTISLDIGSVLQPGVTASFRKVTPAFPAPLTTLTGVALPHRSSIARTVYVESAESLARPVVEINVRENGALVATVYLNANGNAAPLDDPLDPNQRITSGDAVDSIELHTPDIVYRATSIGTPAIDDPAIDDPAIDDPAIDDPAIDDPAIDDPAIDDPAIDDPAIDDPAIDDPAIDDPAIDDPAIDDPAIDDASVSASSIFDRDTSTGTNNTGQKLTQITWKVALKGNTTTSMTSKVFLNVSDATLAALKLAIGPGKSQLLVSRRYRTSDVRGPNCTPVRVSSYQVIANIVDPVLTNSPTPPDLVNPTASEPSFAIPPGDTVYLTFRLWGNVPEFRPNTVGAVVQSQPGPPASEPLDTDIPIDRTAPTLALPGAPTPGVNAEATGPNGAVVTYNVTANDDTDGTVSVVCSRASGTTFPVGTTQVTCSATDSSGNEATGTFNVVVSDTTAPTVTVPANIVAEATSAAGAAVTFSASATDLVAGALTPTCAPASGATFPLGVTIVNCSASDGTNTGRASFTITVRDTVAPLLVGTPTDITVFGGASGAVVTYTPPTAADAVSGPRPVSCSPASGSTFVGTTIVTCSASDTAAPTPNTATSTFRVTVTLDIVGPTITSSVSPTLLWPPDGAQVTVTISGIANDTGSGVASINWSVVDEYHLVEPSGSISSSNGPFSFQIVLIRDRKGSDKDGRHYTIKVTATDRAGNVTAAAPMVVNVHDQSGG